MYPAPRLIYMMSNDGLLMKFLSFIPNLTRTPVFATLLTGFLAGLIEFTVIPRHNDSGELKRYLDNSSWELKKGLTLSKFTFLRIFYFLHFFKLLESVF